MEHIGIDVHKNESQICRLTEEGEVVERRVATRRDRFDAVLGMLPRARILIEASTESEWVARCLEELGHEVIVADPNFAPMYASRSRRVKTDRRDAQALMDACRLGAYRRAHRTSEPQRRVRTLSTVRDNMVRTRVRQIQVVRALLRREGLRVRSGQVTSFGKRMDEVDTPQWLRDIIAPLRAVMDELNRQMVDVDRAIEHIVREDPVVQRLCTAPGIGPVTAVAFVHEDRQHRGDIEDQPECVSPGWPASAVDLHYSGPGSGLGVRRNRKSRTGARWSAGLGSRPRCRAGRSADTRQGRSRARCTNRRGRDSRTRSWLRARMAAPTRYHRERPTRDLAYASAALLPSPVLFVFLNAQGRSSGVGDEPPHLARPLVVELFDRNVFLSREAVGLDEFLVLQLAEVADQLLVGGHLHGVAPARAGDGLQRHVLVADDA